MSSPTSRQHDWNLAAGETAPRAEIGETLEADSHLTGIPLVSGSSKGLLFSLERERQGHGAVPLASNAVVPLGMIRTRRYCHKNVEGACHAAQCDSCTADLFVSQCGVSGPGQGKTSSTYPYYDQ